MGVEKQRQTEAAEVGKTKTSKVGNRGKIDSDVDGERTRAAAASAAMVRRTRADMDSTEQARGAMPFTTSLVTPCNSIMCLDRDWALQ